MKGFAMVGSIILQMAYSIVIGVAAQTNLDVNEMRVAAAQNQFDKACDKARNNLLAILKKKVETAQRVGNLQFLEQIESEIMAFEVHGDLPTTVPTKAYEAELKKAVVKLESVFSSAIEAYTKMGKITEAKALQARLDDLKPAGTNAIYKVVAGGSGLMPLQNGGRAFSNRNYVWTDIPQGFPLKNHVMIAGNGRTPLTLEITRRGWVYVALADVMSEDPDEYLMENDWERTELVFKYTDSARTTMRVYRKRLAEGESEIPRLGFSGPMPLLP